MDNMLLVSNFFGVKRVSSPTAKSIPEPLKLGLNENILRENHNSKKHMHPMFISTLFTIARTWKQHKCPSTDAWIKKMWHIYTMEYYSAIKRN